MKARSHSIGWCISAPLRRHLETTPHPHPGSDPHSVQDVSGGLPARPGHKVVHVLQGKPHRGEWGARGYMLPHPPPHQEQGPELQVVRLLRLSIGCEHPVVIRQLDNTTSFGLSASLSCPSLIPVPTPRSTLPNEQPNMNQPGSQALSFFFPNWL